jgi:hypothetical protein
MECSIITLKIMAHCITADRLMTLKKRPLELWQSLLKLLQLFSLFLLNILIVVLMLRVAMLTEVMLSVDIRSCSNEFHYAKCY